MTSPADLHALVVARLRTITTLSTYDGDVPEPPPSDATGRVYPYAVVWPGAGVPTPEGDITAEPRGELAWRTQVTVASGDPNWTLAAAHTVRGVLHLRDLLPGVRLVEEPLTGSAIADAGTTPRRWFFPLVYTCLTP